jgi:hypothetical protein
MKVYLGDRVTVKMIRDAGHSFAPEQLKARVDDIAEFVCHVMASLSFT